MEANVKINFYQTNEEIVPESGAKKDDKGKTQGADSTKTQRGNFAFGLFGYLTDEGLSLSLQNRFANALDLAGSILGQFGEFLASAGALRDALSGNETFGYITPGIGNRSIILNSPYYWQGSSPIEFKLSMYQIADYEEQIIKSYQRVLEILSPWTGRQTKESNPKSITFKGEGPGIAYVHYFPKDGTGEGEIQLGPCLCSRVSMEIKAPYSASHLPIIGAYSFDFATSRIIDRGQITKIFNEKFPFEMKGIEEPKTKPPQETPPKTTPGKKSSSGQFGSSGGL